MSTLFDSDYIAWVERIVRISNDALPAYSKVIILAMPQICDESFSMIKEDYDTWTDINGLVHCRVRMQTCSKFTGIQRKAIGKSLKAMHNSGIISYRYFREVLGGSNYVLSYLHVHDKLWEGDITRLLREKKDKRFGRKTFVPCRKCECLHTVPTGGIERECPSCHSVDVYYRAERRLED
jgi:hypothetical protein